MQIKLSNTNYQKRFAHFMESEEIKAYTMAILSLFAISFFTIFAIRPTLITFFSLNRQIEDSQQLDQQLEDKINMLLRAQENYQTYKNDVALVNQAVPQDAQFTSLVKKVEELAKNQNTTLASLKIEGFDFIEGDQKDNTKTKEAKEAKEAKEKGPLSFSFIFSIKGNYADSESFIKNMMNLRRIIAFNNLKISISETDNNELTTASEAKTFYLKNE